MYERRTKEAPSLPPPPIGTIGHTRPPGEVRIGDFVYLDGEYHRVRDMRSACTAARRVLIFAGREPWVMREARTTYRPIGRR